MAATRALLDWFAKPEQTPEMIWDDCPKCWAQRREYVYAYGRWHARPCTTCLGLGSVPREEMP